MTVKSGWKLIALGKIAPANSNGMPDEGTEVWNLSLDEVEPVTGRILNKTLCRVSELGSAKCSFDTRHVLYSKLRPYLNKVVLPDESGVGTSELIPMLPDPKQLDREFLAFYLRSPMFLDFANANTRGANLPRIAMKELWKHKVPVPDSLDEQRRIVARIKECMERVEEIEGLRAEAIEESDALVQSVLHDTWRSDEIASAEKMALDELGQITTGNTPSRKKPEFFGGSQPWVTPGDFNGRLIATGRECLSKKGIAEGRARVVPEGSVLVVCIGATIGKVALAVRDLGINQQINAVTFDKEKVLPEYGYWACRALVPEIIGNASKNTLPILNKGKFSKLQIPVPSLYIQEQVSSKLDAVEAAVSEMRRDLSESNTASTAFRDSILRKAFAGDL